MKSGGPAWRAYHGASASFHQSQFDTLEPPAGAIEVDVAQPVERCVQLIVAELRKKRAIP